jgi:ABC-2 type transport system permease protein
MTIWTNRRAWLWWAVGVVALTVVTLLFYPSVRDTPEYDDMLADMPDAMRGLIGGEGDITSPSGYLNSQLFGFMIPLVFLLYAAMLGAGTLAGEEERDTLDLLLATPVSRRRVVLEKALGAGAVVVALAAVFWLALWSSARLVDMEIGAEALLAACAGTALLALVFGGLALMLGAITGRRAHSLGITAAVALVSFILNGLGSTLDAVEPFRPASPFYHALGTEPLTDGFAPAHLALLLGLGVLFAGVAAWAFDRRDVAV